MSMLPENTVPIPACGFRFDSLKAILESVIAPSWLIRDYIEADTHILLFGESEACKSFLVLDMALHVASGREWCNQPVKQGPVFYINGEGRGGFSRRVKAWCIAHQVDIGAISFFTSHKPTKFCDSDAAEEVGDAILELSQRHGKPAMVVIDTLAKNLGADENSNQDIAEYVRNVDALITRQFGCSVITVHHVGHGDKTRARGAYALKADFDADMIVARQKTVTSDQVVFTPGKMKDGRAGDPLAFNTRVVELGLADEWGRPITSLVLDQTTYTPVPNNKTLGKAQRQCINVLKAMYTDAQRNIEADGRGPEEAMIETVQWRTRLENEVNAKGEPLMGQYPNQRWPKIRESLKESGAIVVRGAHVFVNS